MKTQTSTSHTTHGSPQLEPLHGNCQTSSASKQASFPLDCLPYAEVWFSIQFLGSGSLPPFRGPTLRGGFGYHLKRTVCHVHNTPCGECLVRSSCVYGYIFEGMAQEGRTIMRLYPYVPQPFVLLVEPASPGRIQEGDTWQFGLRLFGQATEQFPYIAYSLMELGHSGLGKDRIAFEVQQITQTGRADPLYQAGNQRLARVEPQTLIPNSALCDTDHLILEFVTPARLRVQGHAARQIRFSDLVKAACRRLTILTHFYGLATETPFDPSSLIEKSHDVTIEQDQTRWHQFDRYSTRQQRKMSLGGLLGRITFAGDMSPYRALLQLIELTHIGKATSFGFGRILVDPPQTAVGV